MIERGEIRKTRLLIADDHTLVLEGLKRILEADFDLVGMAENGRDVLRKAEELKPDVVLMDISMPADSSSSIRAQGRSRTWSSPP